MRYFSLWEEFQKGRNRCTCKYSTFACCLSGQSHEHGAYIWKIWACCRYSDCHVLITNPQPDIIVKDSCICQSPLQTDKDSFFIPFAFWWSILHSCFSGHSGFMICHRWWLKKKKKLIAVKNYKVCSNTRYHKCVKQKYLEWHQQYHQVQNISHCFYQITWYET